MVQSEELFGAARWTVSYFAKSEAPVTTGFPMRALREVVRERRGGTNPQQLGDEFINYIGLENIRSHTGELVDFAPKKASAIKSRSKLFRRGDVLYGRLRPELNKVYLAEGAITEGICSSEIIIFIPTEGVLLPRYLRHILASRFVTQFAEKYKTGAALPRMDTDGLLSIRIPIPPLPVQEQFARKLKAYDEEIAGLRARLDGLPMAVTQGLVRALEGGDKELKLES